MDNEYRLQQLTLEDPTGTMNLVLTMSFKHDKPTVRADWAIRSDPGRITLDSGAIFQPKTSAGIRSIMEQLWDVLYDNRSTTGVIESLHDADEASQPF